MSKATTDSESAVETSVEQTDDLTDYERADLLKAEVKDVLDGYDGVEDIEVNVGSQTGAHIQFKVDSSTLHRSFYKALDDVDYSDMKTSMTMIGSENVVKFRVSLWP